MHEAVDKHATSLENLWVAQNGAVANFMTVKGEMGVLARQEQEMESQVRDVKATAPIGATAPPTMPHLPAAAPMSMPAQAPGSAAAPAQTQQSTPAP